ncbi:MAG: caspase family protein [Rhizobiales bacterium]|nr:caspase family protein [Hyphomicrobiales bacterium]
MLRGRILHFLLVLFGLLYGVGSGQSQQFERRIALVIGNGAYQVSPLATAANDAGLIAQTLQAAGFDVVGARDLDAATLRSVFREFVDKARMSGPDTVAFVYFAGHALQFEGENYLVPVDARIAAASDVPLAAIRLADLTRPLAALAARARIVVLDAGRASSFARSGEGLAAGLAPMRSEAASVIAFNASPGTVGAESGAAYGHYATALAEMIKAGGVPLDALFERVRVRVSELTDGAQLTWNVSLVGQPVMLFERTGAAAEPDRFQDLLTRPITSFDVHGAYLAALARDAWPAYREFLAAHPDDPQARRVHAIMAVQREAMTWWQALRTDHPEGYWSYLVRYPRGPHVIEARRRLSHLAAALEPPPSFSVPGVEQLPVEEMGYPERPVISFADPVLGLAPPPVSAGFLSPRPAYFAELPPPLPSVGAFVLPIPVSYRPVPAGVDRPRHLAPAPVNVIGANIHNRVDANPADGALTVTDPAGRRIQPIPGHLGPYQPTAAARASAKGRAARNRARPITAASLAVALPAAVPPGWLRQAGPNEPRSRSAPTAGYRSGHARIPAASLRQERLSRQRAAEIEAAQRAAEQIADERAQAAERSAREWAEAAEKAARERAEAAEQAADQAARAERDSARERAQAAEQAAQQRAQQAVDQAARERSQAADQAVRERAEAAERAARHRAQHAAEQVARERAEAAEQATRQRAQQAAEQAAREQAQAAERAAAERAQAAEQAARQRAQAAEQTARERTEAAERAARERVQAAEQAARQRAQQAAEQRARETAEQSARETQQRAREATEQRAREAEQRARETAQQRAREAEQKAREAAEQSARDAQQRAREASEQRAREAEQRAREAAEQRAREAEQKARDANEQRAREAEQRAREAAQQRAREAEQKAREAAEQRAREAEQRARDAAQQRAREAEQRAREASEQRAREAEQRAREAAQQRAREAEQRAREAAEQRAREAEQRAREAAEQRAREAEQRAREAAQQRAREAEQRAREAAERQRR